MMKYFVSVLVLQLGGGGKGDYKKVVFIMLQSLSPPTADMVRATHIAISQLKSWVGCIIGFDKTYLPTQMSLHILPSWDS